MSDEVAAAKAAAAEYKSSDADGEFLLTCFIYHVYIINYYSCTLPFSLILYSLYSIYSLVYNININY